jgi:mRNA-degrading endonuclease RelE of RelBE toxin-antitoxin system
MNHPFELSAELLEKLAKKDRNLAIALNKKIRQIVEGGETTHYKNLRGELSRLKRVHVGNFVLLFRVRGETIVFEKLAHHDDAYE